MNDRKSRAISRFAGVFKKSKAVGLLLALTASLQCAPCLAIQKYGVVDSSGHWIIEPKYQFLCWLGDGLYLATRFQKGSMAFPPHGGALLLDEAGKEFSVQLPESCELHSALTGRIKPVKSRSELMLVISKGDKEGACDITGKIILPPIYDSIKTYNEGFFTVDDQANQATLFIDRGGKVLSSIPVRDFNFFSNDFHEGVILGEDSNRLYTGEQGGVLRSLRFFRPNGIQLQFPNLCSASHFSEGYAAVTVSDQSRRPLFGCYLNNEGKLLAGKKFKRVYDFIDGQAIVGVETKPNRPITFGIIDKSGKFVVDAIYDGLQENDDKSYIATGGNGAQLIDRQGKSICSFGKTLAIFPSSTPLPKRLKPVRELPPTKYAYPGYVDRDGHTFDPTKCTEQWPIVPARTKDQGKFLWGLRSKDGWMTEHRFHGLQQLPGGNWLARYESPNFDLVDWQMHVDRLSSFRQLLAHKNLIGMSKVDVTKLLGEADDAGRSWIRYYISNEGGCGFTAQAILLQFEGEKLKRWQIAHLMSPIEYELSDSREWFSQNVVFENDLYIPKAVAEVTDGPPGAKDDEP